MLSLFPCLWAPSMVSNANQQATSFFKNFVKAFPVVKSYAYSERVVKRATIFYNLELLNANSLSYPKHSTPLPFEMITIRAYSLPLPRKMKMA